MKLRPILIATIVGGFALSLLTYSTEASDWTGIYARVDKVVFEPNAAAPERIQIWGAFAVATVGNRNTYEPAQRGYLYYSLKEGKEDVCKKEWADLKSVAGSGQIIAFAGRNQTGRVRKSLRLPCFPRRSVATRRDGRVVRQRIANPCTPVQFWVAPPAF